MPNVRSLLIYTAGVWAVAPGQAAVLYDGDIVVGGGRIERPAEGRGGLSSAAPRVAVAS